MNLFPGDGKQKREGPCVGTKGFRAPEVRTFNHFRFSDSGGVVVVVVVVVIFHALFILKSSFIPNEIVATLLSDVNL